MPQPRAALVVSHGFGEHILRYEHVARFFNRNGIMVCGLDHQVRVVNRPHLHRSCRSPVTCRIRMHQGHGQSEGDRAHVVSFDDYAQDLAAFATRVRDDNPGVPLFLVCVYFLCFARLLCS